MSSVKSRPAAAQRSRRSGRQAPPRENRTWLWLLVGVGLVMLVVGLIVLLDRLNQRPGEIEGVQSFSPLERGHVTGLVNYAQTPPVGGQHNATWQNCGIYDTPVQNEYAVHSLEHGAVWIAYQPELPAQDVERLRNAVRGKSYTLLAPFPGLENPVVASAWGLQLRLDSSADPRLVQFVDKYRLGPQTPEPGAICSGGIGFPIDR